MSIIFDLFYLWIHVIIMNWEELNMAKVKQAPKSMMETLRRLGIPWWLVKTKRTRNLRR